MGVMVKVVVHTHLTNINADTDILSGRSQRDTNLHSKYSSGLSLVSLDFIYHFHNLLPVSARLGTNNRGRIIAIKKINMQNCRIHPRQ
jgi:chromosome condensin MukBEF ATPase and DNA-binding subunit MukB